MDNRIAITVAAYYGDWKNKKSRNSASIRYTCGEGPQALLTNPGCRGAAFGEAGAGQLSTTINGPFFSQTNAVITGMSKIYGFEVEGNAAVTEELTTGWTLNYAGNKFTRLVANFIQSYSQFTNAKGNSHARFPKWAGSFNAGYQTSLTENWDWFLRGDVSYFGKTFLDVDNLAYCKGYWMTNARMGVEGDGTRIEFWVKNALQERNWSACARWSEFDRPFDASFLTAYQTAIVAPQNKRQIGIKTSIKF